MGLFDAYSWLKIANVFSHHLMQAEKVSARLLCGWAACNGYCTCQQHTVFDDWRVHIMPANHANRIGQQHGSASGVPPAV